MKKLTFTVMLCLAALALGAQQMAITRSVTTILEKYENKWQHWGGDAETIKFAAVKFVSGADSSVTMQILVTNKDWEKTATSTGIATNGYGWAVGGSVTQTVQKRVGLIVLPKAEAQVLFDFENEMYLKSKSGETPQFETTWSTTFDNRFVASVTYDGRWRFVWSVDNAVFEIPENEVVPMFVKLRKILNLM